MEVNIVRMDLSSDWPTNRAKAITKNRKQKQTAN